jgi:hypothetical protein
VAGTAACAHLLLLMMMWRQRRPCARWASAAEKAALRRIGSCYHQLVWAWRLLLLLLLLLLAPCKALAAAVWAPGTWQLLWKRYTSSSSSAALMWGRGGVGQ